jgi:D-tyrosyl-tRNA(Tyr) deacylase
MKAVIQRVTRASVTVNDQIIGQISHGLLVLFAIHTNDTPDKIKKMANKIVNLRIFADSEDKMNLSANDIRAELLVVSQFTLYGDTRKGNRPSFIESAQPVKAKHYYEALISELKKSDLKIEQGQFQAQMQVELVNDGPVTITIEV